MPRKRRPVSGLALGQIASQLLFGVTLLTAQVALDLEDRVAE
jgi:hypothetical protein